MNHTLHEFVKHVKKTNVSEITRMDLLEYKQWLQIRPAREGAKNTLRTAGNKMLRVNQFLRSVLKLEPGKGLVTVQDGKFIEPGPDVFTNQKLIQLFDYCYEILRVAFHTMLH